MRALLPCLLLALAACTPVGEIKTSEIRPLLVGDDGATGILGRHDAYAEGQPDALRQSQAVRFELEDETTNADELEAAGIGPVLERHDAGVERSGSPAVLKRLWLSSSAVMRRVLRASRGGE